MVEWQGITTHIQTWITWNKCTKTSLKASYFQLRIHNYWTLNWSLTSQKTLVSTKMKSSFKIELWNSNIYNWIIVKISKTVLIRLAYSKGKKLNWMKDWTKNSWNLDPKIAIYPRLRQREESRRSLINQIIINTKIIN